MITYFLDLYDQIYNFFQTFELSRTILVLKLISYGITFFFIFLIATLLKKSDAGWWLREQAQARHSIYGPAKVNKKWETIQKRLKKGDDASLKLAIIEADNIIDEILRRMGLPGADMGERLTQFEKHELQSVDLVWDAHRLRNMIVHEPTVQISREQAEQAINGYEAALKELEYL